MAQYESEHTRFVREYMAQHPEEQASRMKGRAIWWDKKPEERVPPLTGHHTPKSGGNEYTFEALPEDTQDKEEK